MSDTSYRDYVLDLFIGFGGVISRRMFGGWGLYHESTFFALIFNDKLYFKVDGSNKKMYEDLGSRPFKYERQGKQIALSYWLVPEEIMEDRERLYDLADTSIAIKREREKNKAK